MKNKFCIHGIAKGYCVACLAGMIAKLKKYIKKLEVKMKSRLE